MSTNNIKCIELKLYYKLINEEAYVQRNLALDMIRHTSTYILNSTQISSLIKRFNGKLLEANKLVGYTIEELEDGGSFPSIEIVNIIIVQSEKIIQSLENLKNKKISS